MRVENSLNNRFVGFVETLDKAVKSIGNAITANSLRIGGMTHQKHLARYYRNNAGPSATYIPVHHGQTPNQILTGGADVWKVQKRGILTISLKY